jgi:hypothetical protein
MENSDSLYTPGPMISQGPSAARSARYASDRLSIVIGVTARFLYLFSMDVRTRGWRRSGPSTTVLCALFVLVLLAPAGAKELLAPTGAIIDMPAGFVAGDGDGKTRFSYYDPNDVMEVDILIYDPGKYATSESMAADLTAQMGSQGSVSSFTYQGLGAVVADLSFPFNGVATKGYAIFIAGSAAKKISGYAVVATVPAAQFDGYAELIISALDSFSLDKEARRYPGPVSQFLSDYPANRAEKKNVALPSGSVSIPWSTDEANHTLSVAQREYDVMTLYLNSDTLWQDAWARYYRMVYKESAARLDALTAAFVATIPASAISDPTEVARRALAWVQGFTYVRGFGNIDFVPPLTAAYDTTGDCDSRAVVMAIILEKLGIDSVLMVSRDYSHAMLAVNVPGGGQRFTYNGTAYLVAETTAKIGLGQMDASLTDVTKWLGIDLGN